MSGIVVIGCGYLGRRIAARQLAAGRRVFATTRSPHRAQEFQRLGLEPVHCDVLEPDSLFALPAAADVVYCVGFDRTAKLDMRKVYVDGLANVLTVLDAQPDDASVRRRFVYVSSTGVYAQNGGEEVDETAATTPSAEPGRIALAAERLLRERRPDAVILRFAGIYGPGRLIREQAVRGGEALSGDPEQWLNLIHVEDGAAAVAAALERGKPGAIYNVCDDRPVRRREFYTRMAEVLGAPPPWFPPPEKQAKEDRVNRRIANRRMRKELHAPLRFPSYLEGLWASVDASGNDA
jgi:nucleoside-diphosphate-sugar epimerase